MCPWHSGESEIQQTVVGVLKGYFVVEEIRWANIIVQQNVVEVPVVERSMLCAVVAKSKPETILEIDEMAHTKKHGIKHG